MVKTVIKVDLSLPPEKQPLPMHNRWHPDIPPVVHVNQGEVFRVECLDCCGGQIGNNDSTDDLLSADLTVTHVLSGPIAVNGASPGDLLVVEILDVGPLQGNEWGFTCIFPQKIGGFLADYYPTPAKAVWDIEGIYATSRHIPGVRFAGIPHPGLIGCAPSHSLLQEWNRREKQLVNEMTPKLVAMLPDPTRALVGSIFPDSLRQQVQSEAARTIPPRENGGNCDIKNLSKGSVVYLPVYVEGANLSVGDLHFSEGDGEISFCGAIEMAGFVVLKTSVIKDGVKKYGIKNPIFSPGPVEPHYSRYLTFEGISVDDAGKQHFLDSTLSYKQACLNAIEYLKKFGFKGEQSYLLLSAAPVQGHHSGVVDIPNACSTLAIPTEIFTDVDILPSKDGPVEKDRGNAALETLKK